jgi:hypothetical protein
VVSVDDRKKAEERLKEMNALLILKTTRSSNAAELSLATELAFQNEQKKSSRVNHNNELIFKIKKK